MVSHCFSNWIGKINVTKNSVFDNGGLGTMGGGTGFADYALGADAGCGSNLINDNCFFDHAGVQGLDLGAAMTDSWQGNYYSDLTVVPCAGWSNSTTMARS